MRYRIGINRETGAPLVGWPHCEQSIRVILTTMLGERFMRLGYGSDLVGKIGRNLTPPVVLALYRDAVTALADPRYGEPEYRIRRVQLVQIDRTGALQLVLWGDYYPEGRLGNFRAVEPRSTLLPFASSAIGAVA